MQISGTTQAFFQQRLMTWYAGSERPLPWKEEKDPYKIWLSEIIMQQTRVAQGLPYYERFVAAYPTVSDLANAPDDEVMKQWEGLGYYSRARNLLATARYIAKDLGGVFPREYSDIRALKGVGPYTAAAIASFAYELPYAVVDGNVYRVLSRFLGDSTPVDTPSGQHLFRQYAEQLLDTRNPGRYNQAIMDFGAMHCTPRKPACTSCPLQEACIAFQRGEQVLLPQKAGKINVRDRFFHYLVIAYQGAVLLHRREEKDIWQDLYAFPLLEDQLPPRATEDIQQDPAWQTWATLGSCTLIGCSTVFRQTLSHQRISAQFWQLEATQFFYPPQGYHWVSRKELDRYAFPRIIDWFLQDNSLSLSF